MPTYFYGAGEILGAMITPAVLISASGMLVLSTSNRLGRVVDRIRKLTTEAEGLPDESAEEEVVEKRILIADQIGFLTSRLRLLQIALIIFYSSIGLLVGSSLTVGLSASVKGMFDWLPVVFGLLGATGLMVGASFLVREVWTAVRGTMNELTHIRKVVARKTTVRIVANGKTEEMRGEEGK